MFHRLDPRQGPQSLCRVRSTLWAPRQLPGYDPSHTEETDEEAARSTE